MVSSEVEHGSHLCAISPATTFWPLRFSSLPSSRFSLPSSFRCTTTTCSGMPPRTTHRQPKQHPQTDLKLLGFGGRRVTRHALAFLSREDLISARQSQLLHRPVGPVNLERIHLRRIGDPEVHPLVVR